MSTQLAVIGHARSPSASAEIHWLGRPPQFSAASSRSVDSLARRLFPSSSSPATLSAARRSQRHTSVCAAEAERDRGGVHSEPKSKATLQSYIFFDGATVTSIAIAGTSVVVTALIYLPCPWLIDFFDNATHSVGLSFTPPVPMLLLPVLAAAFAAGAGGIVSVVMKLKARSEKQKDIWYLEDRFIANEDRAEDRAIAKEDRAIAKEDRAIAKQKEKMADEGGARQIQVLVADHPSVCATITAADVVRYSLQMPEGCCPAGVALATTALNTVGVDDAPGVRAEIITVLDKRLARDGTAILRQLLTSPAALVSVRAVEITLYD